MSAAAEDGAIYEISQSGGLFAGARSCSLMEV